MKQGVRLQSRFTSEYLPCMVNSPSIIKWLFGEWRTVNIHQEWTVKMVNLKRILCIGSTLFQTRWWRPVNCLDDMYGWLLKCFLIFSITYIAFFLSKYTTTHEQVTRSAPSREPNDHRDLTLTPDKIKIQCRGTSS